MFVFIGWSGNKSDKVADALHKWLPLFFETAKVWYSRESIPSGKRWSKKLKSALKKADCAIFCLTKENQDSRWMKRELKKLAKSPKSPIIIPYRIGFNSKRLKGKFAKYQSPRATKKDTLMLVQSLSRRVPKRKRSRADLARLFNLLWPELRKTLDKL